MREQIERRLEELRREYDAGTKLLSELETKQANVRANSDPDQRRDPGPGGRIVEG